MSRAYNAIDADGHILEPFTPVERLSRSRATASARPGWSATAMAARSCCSRRSCWAAAPASAASAASAPARASSRPIPWTTRTDARAASIRMRASPTWTSTASTPPSSIPSLGLFVGVDRGPGLRRRNVPRLQPLAGRLLQALSRPPVRHRHAAVAVDRRGDRGDALRPPGARLPRRLPATQSLQRPQAPRSRLRAVLDARPRSSTSASASTRAATAACRRSASTASTAAARSTSSRTRWR